MHYEYAVEPQAIGSSWETFRYLIEKFGFDKGRLISQFPKSWFREVYQATDALTPIQKKKVEEALNQAKKNKVVRFKRNFDRSIGSWLDNALAEHQRHPFHAIIASSAPNGAAQVLQADTVDETDPLMNVRHEDDIPRNVAAISAALREFLRFGSRLVFVDPFIDPFNQRQKNMFRELLKTVADLNPGAECEIHYRYHDGKPCNDDLEREASGLFGDVIPLGIRISLFCWREKEGGEDFHARYLLTEKGGARIDAGFDPVGSHQKTDITLMGASEKPRHVCVI